MTSTLVTKFVNALSPPGRKPALTRLRKSASRIAVGLGIDQADRGGVVDLDYSGQVSKFLALSVSEILALTASRADFWIAKLTLAGVTVAAATTTAEKRAALHQAFQGLQMPGKDNVTHSPPMTPCAPDLHSLPTDAVTSPLAAVSGTPSQPPITMDLIRVAFQEVSDNLRHDLSAEFSSGFGKLRDALTVIEQRTNERLSLLESKCAEQQVTIDAQQKHIHNIEVTVVAQGKQLQECMQMVKSSHLHPVTPPPVQLLAQIEHSQRQLQQHQEQSQREQRKTHLVVTNLHESADLTKVVADLLDTVGVPGIKPMSIMRIGKPPPPVARADVASDRSPPANHAAATARPRPVLVAFSCVQEKIAVLKGRAKLAGSKFSRVGINPSLTKQQQARKNAAWKLYTDAKGSGMKAYWVDDNLYVDRKLVNPHTSPTPPTSLTSVTSLQVKE